MADPEALDLDESKLRASAETSASSVCGIDPRSTCQRKPAPEPTPAERVEEDEAILRHASDLAQARLERCARWVVLDRAVQATSASGSRAASPSTAWQSIGSREAPPSFEWVRRSTGPGTRDRRAIRRVHPTRR
jgi:hypothetical protein